MQGTLRTCEKGHHYYKSSDCPVCPECAAADKPESGFLSVLAAPARRALLNNGIDTLEKLASKTEKEVLAFHGMGKSSIPKLKEVLESAGTSFK